MSVPTAATLLKVAASELEELTVDLVRVARQLERIKTQVAGICSELEELLAETASS